MSGGSTSRGVSEEQSPPPSFADVLYGGDESDDEWQQPLSADETDSDEYDESEEPVAPPYSSLSSPVHRADELDPPLYVDYEESLTSTRSRSRSRSPLGHHPSPPQESSDDIIIFRVMDYDETPLDASESEFFEPDEHQSFGQTAATSAPERRRVHARGRGRVRVRGRGRGRGQGMGSCRRVGDQGMQWNVGHPLQEIWLSDDDVPPELRQMARDLIRRRMNERVNEDEPEEDVDGTDIPLQGEDLHFEWSPMETFRVEEEVFRPARTGAVESYTTAYDAFRSYWDDSILQVVADETNRYANEIQSASFHAMWYPTNVHEVLCLFAFWMMLGIVRMPTINSCFSTNALLRTNVFRRMFTQHRYGNLSKALHFIDVDPVVQAMDPTTGVPAASFDPLYRLKPILDHLNAKFQANYVLSRDICIDESLTLWKGRLNIKQYIRSKAAKFGIKTFELCESATGYLWSFIIYTGKQSITDTHKAPGTLSSTAVVKKLIGPLLNKGYRLFTDNWFNSPLLARFLKRNGTDCVGTLRPTRKDVPHLVATAPLMRGQLVARHSGDVCVLAWQDKNRVTMISTCHGSGTALSRINTNPMRPIPFKPQVVLDYNRCMGGVDLKDHMLEPYLIERKRCSKWYMKMFKRLLNVSILNARILLESSLNSRVDHLSFRLQLVDAILSRHLPHVPVRRQLPANPAANLARRAVVNDGHWPVYVQNRPAHDRGNSHHDRVRCVVCYSQGKQNTKTRFICESCNVPLCVVDCFKAYHTK